MITKFNLGQVVYLKPRGVYDKLTSFVVKRIIVTGDAENPTVTYYSQPKDDDIQFEVFEEHLVATEEEATAIYEVLAKETYVALIKEFKGEKY